MPSVKQFTSWSYSRYSTYKQCPLQARYRYLDKVAEPGERSPHLVRGELYHQKAEDYLKGTVARLPVELSAFGDELRRMRRLVKAKPHLASVEDTIALRADWTLTRWDDWSGCWLRVKIDAALIEPGPDGRPVAVITDWKTGKLRPDGVEGYLEQLELYAVGAFLRWPSLEGLTVRPRLAYLDLGVCYPAAGEERVYGRSELPGLQRAWAKRVRPMMADRRFAPRPNRFCYSCPYGASKMAGGCKYG